MRDVDDISTGMLRMSVDEAAQVLGISTGAVRNRLSRGTLESIKENGTVYVLLSSGMLRDAGNMSRDTGDIPRDMSHAESSALIAAKDETIRVLKEQLEVERKQLSAEREASAELRRIIAGLVQRVPELEAPASPEASESPETAAAAAEGVERHP